MNHCEPDGSGCSCRFQIEFSTCIRAPAYGEWIPAVTLSFFPLKNVFWPELLLAVAAAVLLLHVCVLVLLVPTPSCAFSAHVVFGCRKKLCSVQNEKNVFGFMCNMHHLMQSSRSLDGQPSLTWH